MTTTPRPVRVAALCVFISFVLSGVTFASWAARLPAVRDQLGLSPQQMGLVLLVGSLGSVLALPLSGRIVGMIGSRNTIVAATALAVAGFGGAVWAVNLGSVLLVAVGLFAAMMGISAWDVGMNFSGTVVERRLGRSIMPWFHGGYSIGTVAGAAGGALASRVGLTLSMHVAVVLPVVLIVTLVAMRGLLPDVEPAEQASGATTAQAGYGRSWLEPRTLMVGLVVLAAGLTEGAANDWLALAVVDGFGTSNDVGAFGFTIFVVAMTVMRFAGTGLIDRFGRLAVLRLSTALAILGLLIFVCVPWLPVALVGALLWGLGAALGFPVGMSAASDEPLKAAARLSVVATVGYSAFLVGPGLLGLLAEQVGYRLALIAVVLPLLASLLVLRATRPPQVQDRQR
ncbi:MAG: MFS transporter [Beutenbergiaceae bacterium]